MKVSFELCNQLERLFGRRQVKLEYVWNIHTIIIFVDGVQIDHTLEEIETLLRMYRVSGSKVPYNSYEDLLRVIETEQIDYVD